MGVQSRVKRRQEEQYYGNCAPSTKTLGQGAAGWGRGRLKPGKVKTHSGSQSTTCLRVRCPRGQG